jgi:hypothetical protein
MKENGVVITSSPRPMPSAINAISSASVPEATVMQWRAPVYAGQPLPPVRPLRAP